jgi:hypothetical protein
MQVMVMGLLHLKNVGELVGMNPLRVQMEQFVSNARVDASVSSEVLFDEKKVIALIGRKLTAVRKR